jgi:general transcription factor 3C polypeptide 3 (transcription factor C subunit 4)
VLSHHVKALIGEAKQTYVHNNTHDATRVMQEAVHIEPRGASARTVISQCYAELNEHEKSLRPKISLAHLLHDPEDWGQVARRSRFVKIQGVR